ncbi:MAG: hypothetical protein HY428_01490 [Candidatus Levybacteria bacterium]|nr:hypothetical protein [Candidatus Levybacteria bacterium]
MTEQQAEGSQFFIPQERIAITPEQLNRLQNLNDTTVQLGNTEQSFIGDTTAAFYAPLTRSGFPAGRIGSLRQFLKTTAAENNVYPWEVAQAIRLHGVHDPVQRAKIEKRYRSAEKHDFGERERIAYVSDIHEGSDWFYRHLERLIENPPEYAFFIGDVIGTPELTRLQRLFYNYVVNHIKELRSKNPNATDEEMLIYVGSVQPEEGATHTVRDGFLKLKEEELRLGGEEEAKIKKRLVSMTDAEILAEMRTSIIPGNYGYYSSNLPERTIQNLKAGLRRNALNLIGYIKRLQDAGTHVAIVEGNWDIVASLDYERGIPEMRIRPKEERIFPAKPIFEAHGIPFYDTPAAIETKTSLHILLPFESLKFHKETKVEQNEVLRKAVEEARKIGKTVIFVAHGAPVWEVHKPGQTATGENAEVMKGLHKAVRAFSPDEIVYGHLHDLLVDATGRRLPANTKYALTVTDGMVEAVDVGQSNKEAAIVASFHPIQNPNRQIVGIGLLNIPVEGNRKIRDFGGDREPVKAS